VQGHSALEPASYAATRIHGMYLFFLVVSGLVCAIVIGASLWAALRKRPATDDPALHETTRRRASRGVSIATAATIAVLFVVLVYDLALSRGLGHHGVQGALTIQLTGHQWWWDVDYLDTIAQNQVHTANEIHIPVGRVVVLKVRSSDVIHSFWAPSLGVKKDLIPGHPGETSIEADRAGTFKVVCAEFCGLEHAKMALDLVAEDEATFAAWLASRRQAAPLPGDTLALNGRTVLEAGDCAMCHTVAGTRAGGHAGPDLTHIASRLTIAAGALPNTRENLARWITDPQLIKPGVLMPAHNLAPAAMQSLLAYLATLK
jgi:cytochrome c oxidase subunit 2